MSDELTIVIALLRKLGGEVRLTEKDLIEAGDYELQRAEPGDFAGGYMFRARPAPITIEGETVSGNELTHG